MFDLEFSTCSYSRALAPACSALVLPSISSTMLSVIRISLGIVNGSSGHCSGVDLVLLERHYGLADLFMARSNSFCYFYLVKCLNIEFMEINL